MSGELSWLTCFEYVLTGQQIALLMNECKDKFRRFQEHGQRCLNMTPQPSSTEPPTESGGMNMGSQNIILTIINLYKTEYPYLFLDQ